MNFEFEVDPESSGIARDIASALSSLTEDEYSETQPQNFGGGDTAVLGRPETSKQAGRAHALFTTLARDLAGNVPLSDVGVAVADYEELQRFAMFGQLSLPILHIEGRSGDENIPCLFSRQTLQDMLLRSNGSYIDVEQHLVRAAERWLGAERVEVTSLARTNSLFFQGLQSYLSLRISGVRWLRSEQAAGRNRRSRRARSWFGGIAGATGLVGAHDGQWWKIYAKTPGLSLYWANRFGVKIPAVSVGGQTQPQPKFARVYLKCGDGHIGANFLPYDTIDYDDAILQVPSNNPQYWAQKF